MSDLAGPDPGGDTTEAPICTCGVTALPAQTAGGGDGFVCENPGCEAFGTVVDPSGDSGLDFT